MCPPHRRVGRAASLSARVRLVRAHQRYVCPCGICPAHARRPWQFGFVCVGGCMVHARACNVGTCCAVCVPAQRSGSRRLIKTVLARVRVVLHASVCLADCLAVWLATGHPSTLPRATCPTLAPLLTAMRRLPCCRRAVFTRHPAEPSLYIKHGTRITVQHRPPAHCKGAVVACCAACIAHRYP